MDRVVPIVAARRAQPKHAELEIRLGEQEKDGSFVAGVTKEIYDTIEKDLESEQSLVASRYTEIVDYHYAISRTTRARTRVKVNSEDMTMHTSHVVKTNSMKTCLVRDETSTDACRVSLAYEPPLETPPLSCIPTHVRIQQRRSFSDVRNGAVVWRYDLSKTWSGSSRSVVEHAQNTHEPSYEIEIELVDADGSYMAARSDEDVARSILVKATLLMGDVPSDSPEEPPL